MNGFKEDSGPRKGVGQAKVQRLRFVRIPYLSDLQPYGDHRRQSPTERFIMKNLWHGLLYTRPVSQNGLEIFLSGNAKDKGMGSRPASETCR